MDGNSLLLCNSSPSYYTASKIFQYNPETFRFAPMKTTSPLSIKKKYIRRLRNTCKRYVSRFPLERILKQQNVSVKAFIARYEFYKWCSWLEYQVETRVTFERDKSFSWAGIADQVNTSIPHIRMGYITFKEKTSSIKSLFTATFRVNNISISLFLSLSLSFWLTAINDMVLWAQIMFS